MIDRHYSEWLDVWNELSDHEEKEWMGLNKHAAKNSYLKSKTLFSINLDFGPKFTSFKSYNGIPFYREYHI